MWVRKMLVQEEEGYCRQKQHKKYVNFLDIDEEKKKCGEGEYYCNDDKKCKPIPKGYKIGYGGISKTRK